MQWGGDKSCALGFHLILWFGWSDAFAANLASDQPLTVPFSGDLEPGGEVAAVPEITTWPGQ